MLFIESSKKQSIWSALWIVGVYFFLQYQITNHILSEHIASVTIQATKKMAKGLITENRREEYKCFVSFVPQSLIGCVSV